MWWTVFFEFFKRHRSIGIRIDLLEDFFGLGFVALCHGGRFEFLKAERTAGVRVEFLEDFLGIGALALAGTTRSFRAFGFFLSEGH